MRTILCVDDHAATLLTLALVFKSAGYACLTASNFEDAERAFAAEHIDLMVVDHGLPEMDGAALAARLKGIRAVSVLMLSGSVELAEKPGSVDLLLPKPQAPQELLDAVAELLGPEVG